MYAPVNQIFAVTCSIVPPQASFSAPNAVLRVQFKMLWL